MNNCKAIIVGAFLLTVSSPALASCEDGHWVKSVSSDGAVVILEDGSVWEIDEIDRIDTRLWLPTTNITACDDKLINTDDKEVVDAKRLR